MSISDPEKAVPSLKSPTKNGLAPHDHPELSPIQSIYTPQKPIVFRVSVGGVSTVPVGG